MEVGLLWIDLRVALGAVRSVSAVVDSQPAKHPLMIGGHYIHVISRLSAALALFPFRFCLFLLFRLFLLTGIGISAPPLLGPRLFYSRTWRLVSVERQYDAYWSARGEFRPN